MLTRRQQIIELIAEGPTTVRQLAARLGVRIKDVADDLGHIGRSRRLHVEPSECLDCGFRLTKRARFTAPSRCPRCRSESTTEPEITLSK